MHDIYFIENGNCANYLMKYESIMKRDIYKLVTTKHAYEISQNSAFNNYIDASIPCTKKY